jgi:hypothetical protein
MDAAERPPDVGHYSDKQSESGGIIGRQKRAPMISLTR